MAEFVCEYAGNMDYIDYMLDVDKGFSIKNNLVHRSVISHNFSALSPLLNIP